MSVTPALKHQSPIGPYWASTPNLSENQVSAAVFRSALDTMHGIVGLDDGTIDGATDGLVDGGDDGAVLGGKEEGTFEGLLDGRMDGF